eukprot:365122-Chlamydomonas_euryale.AAC.20
MAAALSTSGSGACRGALGNVLPCTGRAPRGPLPAARRCCTNAARHGARRGGAASPWAPPLDGASGVLSSGTVRCCAALGSGASSSSGMKEGEREVYPGVFEGYWVWRGHRIRYHRSGDKGEPVLLVHGFGGNVDHWRKVRVKEGNCHRRKSEFHLAHACLHIRGLYVHFWVLKPIRCAAHWSHVNARMLPSCGFILRYSSRGCRPCAVCVFTCKQMH